MTDQPNNPPQGRRRLRDIDPHHKRIAEEFERIMGIELDDWEPTEEEKRTIHIMFTGRTSPPSK